MLISKCLRSKVTEIHSQNSGLCGKVLNCYLNAYIFWLVSAIEKVKVVFSHNILSSITYQKIFFRQNSFNPLAAQCVIIYLVRCVVNCQCVNIYTWIASVFKKWNARCQKCTGIRYRKRRLCRGKYLHIWRNRSLFRKVNIYTLAIC